MNAMLASGEYPWTIIRVTRRAEYLAALERSLDEAAGCQIHPLCAKEMQVDWTGTV